MKNVINHFMIYYLCIMLLATAMGYFLSSYVKVEDVPELVELRDSEPIPNIPNMCDSMPFMESEDVYAGRTELADSCEYNSLALPKDRFWLSAREWRGSHIKHMDVQNRVKRILMTRFKAWKAMHISEFIEHMGAAAQEEHKNFPDIPASLYIAQSLIESNFGLSRLAIQGHNLFGHKYRGQKEGFIVAADDSPTDRFTRFKSEWFSLRSHSYLLMRKYRKRISGKPNLDKWLIALCGGMTASRSRAYVDAGNSVYATSCYTNVCYSQKLKRIINHYKLRRFD